MEVTKLVAQPLSGKKIALKIRDDLKIRVAHLKSHGVTPGLAVVLVGLDPASVSYVTAKERACEEIGILSYEHRLTPDVSQNTVMNLIKELNSDPRIHGILVQLPLPPHLEAQSLLRSIDPAKDVDGFHPMSIGKMLLGEDTFLSCTPFGIIKMLESIDFNFVGARVTIVGRSNIVGKPLALMLMQSPFNCTVTVCHTKTKNLSERVQEADLVIAAVGRPGTVTADMVKLGAVVVDVGVNRIEAPEHPRGFVLKGDTEYDELLSVASYITPVPGGVGPMTITMLLYNTIKSAFLWSGLPFLEKL